MKNKSSSVYYPLGILLGLLPFGPVYTALIGTARVGMDGSKKRLSGNSLGNGVYGRLRCWDRSRIIAGRQTRPHGRGKIKANPIQDRISIDDCRQRFFILKAVGYLAGGFCQIGLGGLFC